MTRGVFLTPEIKDRMYNFLMIKGKSVDEVHDLLFDGNEEIITKAYVVSRRAWFENASSDDIAEYITGANKRGGRKRALQNPGEIEALKDLAKQQPMLTNRMIAKELHKILGDDSPLLSAESIRLNIKKQKISTKSITFVSGLLDHEQRHDVLEIMRHVRPEKIHNFDETQSGMKKFALKIARSEVGNKALCTEWYIEEEDGTIFSVIASYTTAGWSSWLPVCGNVNHLTIEEFLRDELAPVLCEGDVVMYDGASIHLVDSTQAVLEEITEGRHVQVSAYSHDFSPVERGFANVWGYIRRHWNSRGGQRAVDLINEAFALYSVSGERGYAAQNHFNLYARNHQDFLNDFA